MVAKKIEEWINGNQNFIVGRVLYNRFGSDENLKSLFRKGETKVAKKLLLDSLTALLKKPVILPQKKINTTTDEMPDEREPILKALREEWMKPYTRMNYLRGKLDDYYDDNSHAAIEMRRPIAFEILELEQVCIQIWAKRDYYLEHGKLPTEKTEDLELPTDPIELGKLLESAKKNIRRNRVKMERPGADAKYTALYLKYKSIYKKITGNEYQEKPKS